MGASGGSYSNEWCCLPRALTAACREALPEEICRTIGSFAEMLCELAEQLMRSGFELQARALWEEARVDYPHDVWVYVQAGSDYGHIGDDVEALEWPTTGMELALHTGDPESALAQLHALRASCLSALGHQPDELQARAAQHL